MTPRDRTTGYRLSRYLLTYLEEESKAGVNPGTFPYWHDIPVFFLTQAELLS